MKANDLRLFLLLTLLAASNIALQGDFGGFLTALEPECDCDAEKTVRVNLSPATLSLVQGESATSTAEFVAGSEQKAASWGMRKPNTKFFKASSLSTSTGATTTVSVTAADSVIPEENWDQGAFCETDSPTVAATGQNQEGNASAVLTLKVWGTQLYWANEDGSVRRWWNDVGDFLDDANPFGDGPAQKTSLSDGGKSTAFYLKLNVPAGVDTSNWDIQVVTKPVQRLTLGDGLLVVYHPWASTHDPSEYVEPPTVEVVNGVIKVGFKTKPEFPGSALSAACGEMPFEVVVKRKSDGLTVRQGSTLGLFDSLNL